MDSKFWRLSFLIPSRTSELDEIQCIILVDDNELGNGDETQL